MSNSKNLLTIVFILQIIFFVGCLTHCSTFSDEEENVVVFYKEYEIHTNRHIGTIHQYVFDSDTCQFSFSSFLDSKIYQRDVSLNIIDSIDVDFYPYQTILDYHFISKDSILLVFFTDIFNGYHDDAMIIIDRNKNILDKIDFSQLPVPMQPKFDLNGNTEMQRNYNLNYWKFPLTFDKGRIIAPISLYDSKGIEDVENLSPISIVHHHQNDSVSETPIMFSSLKDHQSYSSKHQNPIGIFCNSTLYAAYGHEPVIHTFHIETNKYQKKQISFTTIDTVLPSFVKDFYDIQNSYLLTAYQKMYFDISNNTIIWFAQLGADSTESPLSRQNPIKTFVILDTSLHKLAEGIMPDIYDNRYNLIPYNGGFLIKKESKKDGTVVYDYLSYTIEKKKSGYLKNEIRERKKQYNKNFVKKSDNEMMLAYIENITRQKIKDGKILIVPIEASCQGCLSEFTQIIQKNFEKLQNKSLFVILVSDKSVVHLDYMMTIDKFILQSIPEAYQSDSAFYKQLFFIDADKKYLSFVDSWQNPKYLECQSSKIILNKVINPKDFQFFKERMNNDEKD